MYVFVLEWTPALTNASKDPINLKDFTSPPIPHGFIFAAYMVAVMIGSNVFKILSKVQEVETFMRGVLFLSCLAFAVPVLFPHVNYSCFFLIIETIRFIFLLTFVLEPIYDLLSIYYI